MKRKTKVWIIIGLCLITFGLIISVVLLAINGFDFSKFNSVKYQTTTHTIQEDFDNVSLVAGTADIVFEQSANGKNEVICYEKESAKYAVLVENGVLTIKKEEHEKWYNNIGISFSTPKITVRLAKTEELKLSINMSTGDLQMPANFSFQQAEVLCSTGDIQWKANALESLKIKTSTGDIDIKDISVGMLDLKTSTGDIQVETVSVDGEMSVVVTTGKTRLIGVSCAELTTLGTTGDILLKQVFATGKMTIERDTGDVKFEKSDATELSIVTDTGGVSGTLASDKIFVINTNTGDKDVPQSTKGGLCEISTDTGDIILSIEK